MHFVCFFVSLLMCCIAVSTVGWTSWDWSLILRIYLPSVLRHCWFGHLTRKNSSPIRPRYLCLVGLCSVALTAHVLLYLLKTYFYHTWELRSSDTRVRRRSRRTFSTHFEIFRRRFDGVVIYFFFDSDFSRWRVGIFQSLLYSEFMSVFSWSQISIGTRAIVRLSTVLLL